MIEYYKSLHIIFVVTWFAGLFYIVRLFIYHTEAIDKDGPHKEILSDQFIIMEKRLWYAITWPSAILTPIFGTLLIKDFLPIADHPWLVTKLCFVFALFVYHFICGHIRKKLEKGIKTFSSFQLRLFNEGATVFLVAIVFLVKLQDTLEMGKALVGLFAFCLLLIMAVKVAKRLRKT